MIVPGSRVERDRAGAGGTRGPAARTARGDLGDDRRRATTRSTSATGCSPSAASGRQPVGGRRVVISDYNAGRHYGELFEPALASIRIMPGEQSKTVAHAEIIWTEMVRARRDPD